MSFIHRTDVGPLLWIMSLQYFVVQILVSLAWVIDYSWTQNTISDLGNTVCGLYGGRVVCSPQHMWMNLSFVALGITQAAGAAMLKKQYSAGILQMAGFVCMIFAGLGTLVVGLYPENVNDVLHSSGAALPFLLGNIGMIILALSFRALPAVLRVFSGLSGALGLGALMFFMSHIYLGLGQGGVERVVAYPQTIWMIVVGTYLLDILYVRRRAKLSSE